MHPTTGDIGSFEEKWTQLGIQICKEIYQNPEIQKLKANLDKNGFLTLEEKSTFINISDATKYEVIYREFGPEGSTGYQMFSDAWKHWFQEKGVGSTQMRGQRNSVDHILFGSTPDPVQFLSNFEEEIKY